MKQFFYNMRTWISILILFAYLFYIDMQLAIVCIFRYKKAEAWITNYLPRLSKTFFYIFQIAGILNNFHKNFFIQGGPYLIIANHQSIFDIAVAEILFQKHGLRFIAKKQLRRGIPGISRVLQIQRQCLIDREAGVKNIEVLRKFAIQSQKKNSSVLVFPEGTRSRNGSILPFHTTAIRVVAGENPLPIVVLAIDGYKFATAFSSKNFTPFTYRVKILKIFPAPTNQREIKQYTEEARLLIKEQIDAWHAEDEK